MKKIGYEYAIAKNGREAIDLLESGDISPDAILLDIRMPVMPGLAALPQIRSILPSVPVIMLTAFGDLETGLAAMKSGAFDYLVKPSSIDKIQETLEKAFSYRDIMEMKAEEERKREQYRLELEHRVESSYQELGDVYRKLKQMNIQAAYALAETIEAKDRYTQGHCERVRWLSSLLGKVMRLPDEEIEQLEYAALLHDIGKIGIPDAILLKPGKLDVPEFEIMKRHTTIGAKLLETEGDQGILALAEEIAASHHERWDGAGYPAGLGGEEIPLSGRIVALADVFDALLSQRPYKKAWAVDEAVAFIKENRASKFDPHLLDLFLELLPEILGIRNGLPDEAR